MKWLRPAAAILLGVALVALLWEQRPSTHSDPYLTEVDGQPWLIAGLTDARVRTEDSPRGRSFRLRTNSLGFRGPEIGPKTAPRVLALGGSVSMGWGLPEEDTWTALVTRDLDIEVLNVGIPGVEPAALAAWCGAVGPSLDVDALAWVQRLGPEDAEHLQGCVRALGVPAVVVLPPRSLLDTSDPTETLRGPTPVLDLTPVFRKGQREGSPDEDPELLFFDLTHPDEDGALLFASTVGSWLTQLTTPPSD